MIEERDCLYMVVGKINGEHCLTINNETKTLMQWAKEKSIDYKVLYDRVFSLHWDEDKLFKPVSRVKHQFDEHYFDIIDNEHKAYWLGFIYADGYLNNKNPTVGIELNHTDIEHLNKFKNDLQSNLDVKIYNKNSTFGPQTNCRFVFNNKTVYNALLSYGITPTKSLDGTFPTIDDDRFVKDVIRGIFDGDGSIRYRIGANGYPTATISICGTMSVLKTIEEHSGFEWSWSQRHPDRDVDNYSIGTGQQNKIIEFLNYLYKDASIFLNRKYDIYQKIINGRKEFIGTRIPNHIINKQNEMIGV